MRLTTHCRRAIGFQHVFAPVRGVPDEKEQNTHQPSARLGYIYYIYIYIYMYIYIRVDLLVS